MTFLLMLHIQRLTSGFCCTGQQKHTSGYTADIESGKEKFLAAQHSPAERDYVAKYGQKAYRTASGVQVGVMPQPLTPGHTATVRIKALTEQEAAAPGRVATLRVQNSGTFHPQKCPAKPSCYCCMHSYHIPYSPCTQYVW